MKIVTWNCNGALRKKTEIIDSLSADVLVIQECEDPNRSTKKYREWAGNYLWKGENKNKGIGIFAKGGANVVEQKWEGRYDLQINNSVSPTLTWKSSQLQSFLPCLINGSVPLLAVWTKQAKSPNFRYIGQVWLFLQIHKEKLCYPNQIICGDFNSNKMWDEWDRWWNHSDVVSELKSIGLESLYHFKMLEKQGKETKPTFFHQRNPEKPYHIDYVFLNKGHLEKAIIEILSPNTWLSHSDHMPLVFDVENENIKR